MFGEGKWYGRIHKNGTYEPSREGNTKVAEGLTRFAADPAKVAAEHGQLTGRCCFCNRALEDARSTAIGYGPVCADKFGLAWGMKAARETGNLLCA